MKRLLITAAAAMTLVGPLAASPAFARDNDRDWRESRREYRDDRRNYNEGYRDGRRDHRRADRWDNRRHNGYYYRDRWYYGAPPAAYYGRPEFRPGYHAWRRGDRLPRGYRYVVVNDYRRYGYAPPPRGYHYVRDDRGDVILAAIATGIIASVILNN